MATLSLICPHCHTERVGFTSVAEHRHPNVPGMFNLFLTCGHCYGGICAVVVGNPRFAGPHGIQGDLSENDNFTVTLVYPRTQTINAPDHVPENICKVYIQAADNLRRNNWDASGAMSRKALDIATLKINPALKGKFQDRIDRLAEDHLITPAMKEWAHVIRLDGNEAAHEEEFDEATAKDLLFFTEIFLMYAFTLPGMLKERRERTES